MGRAACTSTSTYLGMPCSGTTKVLSCIRVRARMQQVRVPSVCICNAGMPTQAVQLYGPTPHSVNVTLLVCTGRVVLHEWPFDLLHEWPFDQVAYHVLPPPPALAYPPGAVQRLRQDGLRALPLRVPLVPALPLLQHAGAVRRRRWWVWPWRCWRWWKCRRWVKVEQLDGAGAALGAQVGPLSGARLACTGARLRLRLQRLGCVGSTSLRDVRPRLVPAAWDQVTYRGRQRTGRRLKNRARLGPLRHASPPGVDGGTPADQGPSANYAQ